MAENTTTTTTTKTPETTTTTTTEAPTTTTTTTQKPETTTTTTTEAQPSADAPEAGTRILGDEGQSAEDRLDQARREALANAEGEQDVHA